MDLKQLRALLAVAESGSVTKAAELLNVVQPAVSRQLKLLEESVGAPLFARERHGMELTDAGRTLVERARRALRELEQAKAEIKPISGVVSGIVNLGMPGSTCDLIAGDLVAIVKSQFPLIHMRLYSGYREHLKHWLDIGELDVAILNDPKASPLMELQPVLEERLYLVGRPETGLLLDQPQPISVLRSTPLILPTAPNGLRSTVEYACATANIPLDIVAETNSMYLQKTLAMQGLGCTILPSASISSDVARGLLAAAPMTQPDLLRRLAIGLPTTRTTSIAANCVIKLMLAHIKACVNDGRWQGATLQEQG